MWVYNYSMIKFIDCIGKGNEKMEKKLDLILETLQSHENLLHQLIKSVAATNVKVNEIDKKLEKNTTDIEEIRSSMVTQADLKYFNQKIAEHDREIMKIELS